MCNKRLIVVPQFFSLLVFSIFLIRRGNYIPTQIIHNAHVDIT
jgi:hypothetical protein